ncbi:hypothetical protein Clacol_010401 [Clathrus columnatus]|uniref:Uncharacterized protein n=1 Tax=Clathrus columnatus TaxID=1419009 RepID=A0AAV5ATM1_9AGAM|nr:hypothetical protein Clacol_010401 [Clathrus columnatus]
MFMEELFKRSGNASLNIVVRRLTLSDVHALVMPLFLSVAGRVKTLYLYPYWNSSSQNSRVSNLISSFPLLEHIFFSSSYPTDVNLLPICIQNQVKVMQISIRHLGNLTIPGHFRKLTWLSLGYEMNSIPLLSILEALHNLPNLQFLHLFWSSWRGIPETREHTENPKSILTLSRLTVLISNTPVLHLIHAPQLLYLDITPQNAYPVHFSRDAYYRLCGFDFSRITRICCGKEAIQGSSPPHTMWNPTYGWYESHNPYRFVPSNNNYLEWISDGFHAFDLDYPNEFYLSFEVGRFGEQTPDTGLSILNLYIERTTNLAEIVLDGFYPSPLNHTEIEYLSTALRSATTVRGLIILSSVSLQTLCDLLSDGDLVPNLERLSYTNPHIYKDELSSQIPKSLQKLKERSGTRTRRLEIKLKGFPSLQSQHLEEVEKLGFLRREKISEDYFNFFITIVGSSTGI